MAVFIELWPSIFTTNLSYTQLFKSGHSIVLRVPATSSRRRHNGVWREYNPFYSLPSPRISLELYGTFNVFPIIMGDWNFLFIISKTKYVLANLYEYFRKIVKIEGMAHKRYLLCPSWKNSEVSTMLNPKRSKSTICQIMPTFEQIW